MKDNLSYEISHVVVTPQLMELLKQKPKGRYSRLDAYFDLLSRAMVKKQFSILPKTASSELLCRFDTTITDLANKWSWQRATVRDFLSELSAIGQLEREDFYKNMTITFDALKFDWTQKMMTDTDTSKESITDECDKHSLLDSSGETGGKNGKPAYVLPHGKELKDNEPELLFDDGQADMVSAQRRVCKQLYDELFADMSALIREWAYTPKVEHALYRAFYNVCGGSREKWQHYLDKLSNDGSLSLVIYGNEAVRSSSEKIESYFIRFGTNLQSDISGLNPD